MITSLTSHRLPSGMQPGGDQDLVSCTHCAAPSIFYDLPVPVRWTAEASLRSGTHELDDGGSSILMRWLSARGLPGEALRRPVLGLPEPVVRDAWSGRV